MTPELLQDRMPITVLQSAYPQLFDFITAHYPQAIKDKETLHFCGVACPEKNRSYVFLPRGSTNKHSISDARLTMNALARYGQDVESRIGNNATEGGDTNLAATIRNIVTDYQRNGLYSQRLRIRSRNTGKPDWKRTLQRRIPLLDRKGRPVYSDLDCTRFLSAPENLLATVQALTLRQILSAHGWWTSLDQSLLAETADIRTPNLAEVQIAPAIRRFKHLLFDDRSLALASLLEQYWDSRATETEGTFICGVPDFSAIWEHMLKAALKDVSATWNARLPLPAYRYSDGNTHPRSSGGVMDIVVEQDGRIVVADAKYYRATSTATAPGFGDILKQSFYSQSLKKLAPKHTVESYFVFPSWEDIGPLQMGAFYNRDPVDRTDWLEPVNCIYVNVRSIMSDYTARRKTDWLPL